MIAGMVVAGGVIEGGGVGEGEEVVRLTSMVTAFVAAWVCYAVTGLPGALQLYDLRLVRAILCNSVH